VVIKMPSLEERKEDIPLLVKGFLIDVAERYSIPLCEFTDSAMNELMSLSWPGNVRQLKHLVEHIAYLEAGKKVDATTILKYYENINPRRAIVPVSSPSPSSPKDNMPPNWNLLIKILINIKRDTEDILNLLLSERAEPVNALPSQKEYSVEKSSDEPFPEKHEKTERERIIEALRRNRGHRGKTAEELGVSARTLYRKMKALNITDDDIFNFS